MVYMLLGTGFEETEAVAPLDLLRRAGVDVVTVGVNGNVIYGSNRIGVAADISLGEVDLTKLEMVILPGGLGGVTSVRASQEAMDLLRFAWENDKYVAARRFWQTLVSPMGRMPPATPVVKGRWAAPIWWPMFPASRMEN